MCGIAGLVRLSKRPLEPEDHTSVQTLLKVIRHRGPDAINSTALLDTIIGNVRLQIVGKHEGDQPIEDTQCQLVFSGEIFNYKQLSIPSASTYTSDSRALFQALKIHKLAALNTLNGYFAFCFVDRDSIYLVRDRYGEKPLYYSIHHDTLYFCSELKGLVNRQDTTIELPSTYAQLETPIHTETIFKNIYQVAPGASIRIDRKTKHIEQKQWYSFAVQPRTENYKALTEHLRELVVDAVAIRVPKNLPLGCYISGGIDSSLISLLAKPHSLLTYLPHNHLIPSEERYADIVATKLKSSYHKVHPSDKLLDDLIQTIYFNDGPTTTFAAISQYILARAAHAAGLRVTMGGMGADEFLGGYTRYAIALLDPQQLDRVSYQQYQPLISKLAATDTSYARRYLRLLSRTSDDTPQLTTLVHETFRHYRDPLVASSISDAQFTLPPLMTTDDRMNMAHGVENRSPFLDYRIVEYALSLPQNTKISPHNNGVSFKHILKDAFKDTLPREILLRTDKVGFSSDIAQQLTSRYKRETSAALQVLQTAYPHEPYYFLVEDTTAVFSRWRYQIIQLAITHLLFVKKMPPSDIGPFLRAYSQYDY